MDDETSTAGPSRRQMLRGAVLAGGVVWTAPVVQALAPSAYASTSIPCVGCLTGGGQILGGVCKGGQPADKISFGLGPICCPSHDPTEIEVNCHPASTSGKAPAAQNYHFDVDDQVTCRKDDTPAPPKSTEPCANIYRGTVRDSKGNTLLFEFADRGEPSNNDSVKITVTDPFGITLVEGAGSLDRGNLQVHPSLGPIKTECIC